jgi:thioredoxin-related protein
LAGVSTTLKEATPVTRITRRVATAILLVIPSVAVAQEAKEAAKKPSRPAIYDTKADAKEQVKSATSLAKRDARRVLVMFGFNGCGWCHKLHGLLASDPEIHALLADEYVLTMVDIESPNADALLSESKAALTPEELKRGVGFPFLAVLDGDGKVITAQRTDLLEVGDHHDPAKVKAFLETWAAPKASAAKAFDNALSKASSDDKLVFLHFGSPTCGWCHKLDAFLAREDMAKILGGEFVDLKIDLTRMTGADEILKRYNPDASGGIPWFVFLDVRGKSIVTSDGPKGNIGYPAAPEEIEHFVGMLKKAARKLSPAQIDEIEAALKAEGQRIVAARASRAQVPMPKPSR